MDGHQPDQINPGPSRTAFRLTAKLVFERKLRSEREGPWAFSQTAGAYD